MCSWLPEMLCSQPSWFSCCGFPSSTYAVSQSTCSANCCVDTKTIEIAANANHYFPNLRDADVCPPGRHQTQAAKGDDISITRHTETSSESTWTEDARTPSDGNNTEQSRVGAASTASADLGRLSSNLRAHPCTDSLRPSSLGCRPLLARQQSPNTLITALHRQEVLNHAPNDVLIHHRHIHTTLADNHRPTRVHETDRRLLTTDD
jgi:hypothetical protein